MLASLRAEGDAECTTIRTITNMTTIMITTTATIIRTVMAMGISISGMVMDRSKFRDR